MSTDGKDNKTEDKTVDGFLKRMTADNFKPISKQPHAISKEDVQSFRESAIKKLEETPEGQKILEEHKKSNNP